MTNWPTKKLGEIILGIILIIVLIVPIIYIFVFKPDQTFWSNTMGNLLGTGVALITGIPIALWIDRFIKKREEQRKYAQERKREQDILTLIKEEIDFSYNSIFLNGKKGNTESMIIQPLKSDLWDSLVASQELRYIENPKLLNRITSAYYVLKIIKNIEEQAYIALRTSAIVFTTKDGKKENAAQQLLRDARTFDKLFEDSCKEALNMINDRISDLEKYAK